MLSSVIRLVELSLLGTKVAVADTTKTSSIWRVDFSCVTFNNSLKEAVADSTKTMVVWWIVFSCAILTNTLCVFLIYHSLAVEKKRRTTSSWQNKSL